MKKKDENQLKKMKKIVKFLLVVGVRKPTLFDHEADNIDQLNRPTYQVCCEWFHNFGNDNCGVISLKLMILRKYIYSTNVKRREKVQCLKIPSYYPKPLYQWPTYQQEIEKIKSFLKE